MPETDNPLESELSRAGSDVSRSVGADSAAIESSGREPHRDKNEADQESIQLTPTLILLGIVAVAVGLGAGLVMSSMVWK